MEFLLVYCFIDHTVQDFRRLSPIQFTPTDALKQLTVSSRWRRQCEVGITRKNELTA